MEKSQTNYRSPPLISFCFSKKGPSWLFTSFFNSDKESYLQIRKSLPSLEDVPGHTCTQAHVRIVSARHFWSRCHGRVKCNFFNIAGRSYNKVPPLTWHENYDRNYPSRFVTCRSCTRWGLCSYETNIFSSREQSLHLFKILMSFKKSLRASFFAWKQNHHFSIWSAFLVKGLMILINTNNVIFSSRQFQCLYTQ